MMVIPSIIIVDIMSPMQIPELNLILLRSGSFPCSAELVLGTMFCIITSLYGGWLQVNLQ